MQKHTPSIYTCTHKHIKTKFFFRSFSDHYLLIYKNKTIIIHKEFSKVSNVEAYFGMGVAWLDFYFSSKTLGTIIRIDQSKKRLMKKLLMAEWKTMKARVEKGMNKSRELSYLNTVEHNSVWDKLSE